MTLPLLPVALICGAVGFATSRVAQQEAPLGFKNVSIPRSFDSAEFKKFACTCFATGFQLGAIIVTCTAALVALSDLQSNMCQIADLNLGTS